VPYKVNSTETYHRNEIATLGWELTVCNTIYEPASPARAILQSDKSYGEHLFAFFEHRLRMPKISAVLEVGGGYGYLMRGLLNCFSPRQITMIDISPFLVGKQKEALKNFNVTYIIDDFLAADTSAIAGHDLIIFNENLGDFPTITDLDENFLTQPADDPIMAEFHRLCRAYKLERPKGAVNFGALLALEKVCRLSIPNIFIAEHSCEAAAPAQYAPYVEIVSKGSPQRIALRGHDEYTIKFSDLQQVAHAFGYQMLRGPMADVLPFNYDNRLRSILTREPVSDGDEIIQHFFSDLFQYEYLLLIKDKQKN